MSQRHQAPAIRLSPPRWTARAGIVFALAVGAFGCSEGAIGGSGGPPLPGGTGSGGGGGLPPPPKDLVFTPEVSGLRRLTVPQYHNSIKELFGDTMTVTTSFEPDTELSGFASIGAARVGLSANVTEQFEASSFDIAKKVLSDATRRTTLVGCSPTTVSDDACTSAFLRKMGRRAWRRPMTDEEVMRYTAVANGAQTKLADFFGGLEYGLAGLLQSPNFLYRQELGTPDPRDARRVVFDDHELATRLSFFIWNSTPDDQLLDAADGRQLTTLAGLVSQAQRLLASPRAAAGMQTFFSELYRLRELDALPQLPTAFPQMTPTLGASMRAETLRFLNEIAFVRDGDFREIFDGRSTFVNAELAKVYGMPGVTGNSMIPVTLPETGMRSGLLGQGSFLAIHSAPNRSSPTRRGKFIREMLLCHTIPAAPPDIEPFPEAKPGTARDKLTAHREAPSCRSCHAAMDPIGLGLENFDGLGVFRTTDAGLPIDASGDVDGVTFSGPRQLATVIKNHPDSAACIVRNVYRYALGHVEGHGEEDLVLALAKGFQTKGFNFRSLLESTVQSPGFTYAAKAE